MSYILSGLIGGLFAAMLYPLIVHVGLRRYNRYRVKISVDKVDSLNFRVTNNSFVTLKNVTAYVTINNTKDDLPSNVGIQVFCSDKQVLEDRLSWSRNVDGKNSSEIDIHQGESQKLNVIKKHPSTTPPVIEIAS